MWHLYETSGENFGTVVVEVSEDYGGIELMVAAELSAQFPENYYEWREVAEDE